jgi:sugar (pentulose or hexulose) kinase
VAVDRFWLGLDLGTHAAKAMAVTDDGEVVGSDARPLTSWRDGAMHEQDPMQWWEAVAAACRAAMDGLPKAALGGLAVCGTSGTVLLVDAATGVPRTPGLMYDDTRAAGEAAKANQAGADTWAALGHRIQPSWALPKLLWLLRERPDLIDGARLIHQPDVITGRLVGGPVPSDTSHALKTGFDLLAGAWPTEAFDELGVPAGVLPEVVGAGSVLGVVCADAAAATGIPEGTPVVAGMTDGCAAQLSAGAITPGSWNSMLGTTLVLKGASDRLIRDPAGLLYSHLAPGGGWLPGGASSTGAGAVSARFGGRDLDELGRRAAEREPAGAVTYPLVARGERFPFSAPDAERFTLGQPADEADEYAALLQGVAFVERLCFDYLDLLGAPTGGELRLTGHGARSRYWCQLRADVLGRPVRLPANAEAGLGMAVLAAAGVTGRPVAEAAAGMVRTTDGVEPRPDRAGRFHGPYLRLVDELAGRGWLPGEVADHAYARAV